MENLPNSNPQTDWRNYIENAPLYTRIAFSSDLSLYDDFYCPLNQIEGYCPKCRKIQLFNRWNRVFQESFNQVYHCRRFLLLYFECVEHNCGCIKAFFVHVERINDQFVFTKSGEYPSLSPRVDEAILNVFPDDADLLKKAVCCLKDGFGVGAFAYFRQILESHIDLLISEIEKMAREQEDTETLEKLAQLRGNGQMSKNIDLAKNALPVYLRVKGYNPLGLLYKTLSEGIHGLSDSECLGKANAIYGALTFILKTLAENSASRKRFISDLNSLNK